MSWHCLLFEANSIQSWVFGSGRLRHIVGGSRIISGLTSELLDSVLEGLALNPQRDVQFSRRAGGAFYAFSQQPEALARLAECWPLFVERYAPGLSFSMARATVEVRWTPLRLLEVTCSSTDSGPGRVCRRPHR